MAIYGEDSYENALIELFTSTLGYEYVYGPDIDRNFHSPLYDSILEASIYRLNPNAPQSAIEEALQKLRNFENAELVKKNALFMEYLQNGIEVSYSQNGETKSDIIYIVDKIKQIKQKQRVVKIVRYLREPERSSVEISNV